MVGILKSKEELEVYDPRGEKKLYSKENPIADFLNIVSLVKKGKHRLPKIDFSKPL